MAQFPRLTNREWDVLKLLLQGKSNKLIASSLSISDRTVEFHLKNIYAKFQVNSRIELILKLVNATGWLEAEKLGRSTVDSKVEIAENRDRLNSQMVWAKSFRDTVSIIGKEARMRTNRLLVLIGGLILILGSRLPWMSVPVLFGVEGPTFEAIEIGWEDNGFITAGIGLILLLVAMFWRGRIGKRYSIPGTILAALAVLVVIGCFYRILEIDPGAGFFAATDVGIYVTLIGALLALVGTWYRTSVQHKRQDTAILSSSV